MLKSLIVLSYEKALDFNPEDYGKTAVIRISSKDFTPLKYQNKFEDVLELIFLDITDEDFYRFSIEEIENLKISCPNPYPISTYQVEQIIRFIYKNLKKIDTMLIHCDAGVSRSPAVAYFIAKHFLKDKNLANKFLRDYLPNETVIKRLEDTINNLS